MYSLKFYANELPKPICNSAETQKPHAAAYKQCYIFSLFAYINNLMYHQLNVC